MTGKHLACWLGGYVFGALVGFGYVGWFFGMLVGVWCLGLWLAATRWMLIAS